MDVQKNSQGNSLEKWERQKEDWDNLASRLAAKAGKRETDVLHNTVHHWRERQEELNYIQASIPQAARATESGWEMSLRDQGDGVRYVRFGTDYPYPLYCPISNIDNVSSDNNVFMRVVTHNTETSAQRATLKESSSFYRQRGDQYKKFIAKKFAHVQHAERTMLCVVGERPAFTSERVVEDVNAPVQHYECVFEGGDVVCDDKESSSAVSAASKPLSAPASVDAESAALEQQQHPRDGPLLLLAASRLQFSTEPHILAHQPLKATNFGTTAIFYSWKPIPNEPIRTASGDPLPYSSDRAAMFSLGEAHSGVLLPDQEHNFAFSFRSTKPCVASERWELQTVPSGKEPFILHLRGVATSRERDPLSVKHLSDQFNAKIRLEKVRSEERKAAAEAEAEAVRLEEEKRRSREQLSEQDIRLRDIAAAWEQANATQNLTQQDSVCKDFLLFHTSVESALFYSERERQKQRMLQEADLSGMEPTEPGSDAQKPPAHPNPSQSTSVTHSSNTAIAAAAAAAKKQIKSRPRWNGSVAQLQQDVLRIPFPTLRGEYLAAFHDMLRAARFNHEPHGTITTLEQTQHDTPSQTKWVSVKHHYSVTHHMLLAVISDIVDIDNGLQENLGLVEVPIRGAGTAKGKAAKAAPKKGGKSEETKLSPEEARAALKTQFAAAVRTRLEDMVEQSLLMYESSSKRVEKILHCPGEFVVKHLRGSREPTPEVQSRRVSLAIPGGGGGGGGAEEPLPEAPKAPLSSRNGDGSLSNPQDTPRQISSTSQDEEEDAEGEAEESD